MPTKDRRPVLLGMNNPVSSDPAHALYPHPPGCAGHRLWGMLNEAMPSGEQVSRSQYLRAFDRRNLVAGKTWSQAEARAGAGELTRELRGRVVVVLGQQPRQALGLPLHLIHPIVHEGVTWRQVPHPSGRNHYYNDATNRRVVGELLAELYRMSTGEQS